MEFGSWINIRVTLFSHEVGNSGHVSPSPFLHWEGLLKCKLIQKVTDVELHKNLWKNT